MINFNPSTDPKAFFRLICENLAMSGCGDPRTDPVLRNFLLKELTKLNSFGNNQLSEDEQASLDTKLRMADDLLKAATGQSIESIKDLLNNINNDEEEENMNGLPFNPEDLLPNMSKADIEAATPEHVKYSSEKLEKNTRLAFSKSTGDATRKQAMNFLIKAAEAGYKLPPQRHKEILSELNT